MFMTGVKAQQDELPRRLSETPKKPVAESVVKQIYPQLFQADSTYFYIKRSISVNQPSHRLYPV